MRKNLKPSYLKVIVLIFLLIFLFLSFSSIISFVLLLLLGAASIFAVQKMRLPVDISLVFAISVSFAHRGELSLSILYAIVAGIGGTLLSGKSPDSIFFMFIGLQVVVNAIALYLHSISLIEAGIIVLAINAFVGGLFAVQLGSSPLRELSNQTIFIIMNVFYFSIISGLI